MTRKYLLIFMFAIFVVTMCTGIIVPWIINSTYIPIWLIVGLLSCALALLIFILDPPFRKLIAKLNQKENINE